MIDRYGVGNDRSSSRGPTRLWRLADPDPVRVRLSRRGLAAMQRLAGRTGREVHLRRGLLWRHEASHARLVVTLGAEGVRFTEVAAGDVGRAVPGLAPDGRDAVFSPTPAWCWRRRRCPPSTACCSTTAGACSSGPSTASTAGRTTRR